MAQRQVPVATTSRAMLATIGPYPRNSAGSSLAPVRASAEIVMST
jgi:hypothetical protein